MSDAAFTPHRISSQMSALLAAARAPVLTDIQIGIPGGGGPGAGGMGPEMYPFPVPDLFVGAPVMVSGKMHGGLPPIVEVKGRLADGREWSNRIQVVDDLGDNALDVPLDMVFIKQRIDLLTARAWLQREKVLEDEVAVLSVRYGVPCPHTKMCAFETTASKEAKMHKAQKSGKAVTLAKYAVGGAAGVLVLGSMAGADFGDVGASVANLGSGVLEAGEALGGSLAGLELDVPDLGCLDDNPVIDALEPCIGAAGSAIEFAGSVVEGVLGCLGGDL